MYFDNMSLHFLDDDSIDTLLVTETSFHSRNIVQLPLKPLATLQTSSVYIHIQDLHVKKRHYLHRLQALTCTKKTWAFSE